MTENNMVDIPNEGEQEVNLGTEDNTSEASPAENNELDDTQSTEGDDENTQEENQDGAEDGDNTDDTQTDDNSDEASDAKLPFHKQKRWIERETEWKERFNTQETRHTDDIAELRKEITGAAKPAAEKNTEIPSWFGGDQNQWNDYLKFQDQRLESIGNKATEKITEAKKAEDKAVEEATTYMENEISDIQADKTLNPEGKKIDANKLLAIVMKYDLVNSKGQWNYKAGMAHYKHAAKPAANTKDRKIIAGAGTSNPKGESKPSAAKTSEDFKTNKPW